ncbi:deleted in lung and esophageal cancer protein 1-like [Antedon mediterranea]|uniref:deleted in lung and esophageal cancer protein 1-like n=1 Tax=Antedon mediterranea TaxID=105859 RepID=UPI003AF780FE
MSAGVRSMRSTPSEPPMFLQRPSSGSSQNVEHILARTFRQYYTRDLVSDETVRNLNKSRAGDNSYHDKYVDELTKVQAEHERRLAEASMLSQHIMQARAKALEADKKDLDKAAEGCDMYHELGLPPSESNYRSFLDLDLLKNHNLIIPEDFSTAEKPITKAPKGEKRPHYSLATETSTQHGIKEMQSGDWQSECSSSSPLSSYSVIDPIPAKVQWKDHMSAEKRERDRKDLAIVHKKSDFLRNPRHRPPSEAKGGKLLIKPNKVVHKLGGAKPEVLLTSEKEPSVIFLATPSKVVFTDYKVRQVYEMTLDLKNVSAASRKLRVIPPKTEYFSVGLGQFPGEYGIIAPGMSCQYNLRFIPDALMDFDDELQIQTQSSQPLVVQLQGRRKPPQLTLDSVIDCGYCLVGGRHVAQFTVKNTGGSGKFCIMPSDSWPATNLKSLNPERVKLEPFLIQPAMFELPAGYSILLQVVFTPASVDTFIQKITMICDNCHVKHFTLKGEGQEPGVKLVSVKPGGESFPLLGEICDTTAGHLINFDTLNPMTYAEKKVQIQNTTNVPLSFSWDMFKPSLECPKAGMTSSPSDGQEIGRLRDGGGHYCIAPDQGTLSPNAIKEFIVGFSPDTNGSFHNVAHLVLHGIPVINEPKPPSGKANKWNGNGTKSSSASTRELTTKDLVGLQVELKAKCEACHVLVQPYAIIVPGSTLVTTTIRKQFQMVNFSQYPVTFSWSSLSDCHIVEVETPQGIIPAGEVADLKLTITGGQPGLIDHTLLCKIEYQDEPLMLRVRAHIKGPEVVIDTASVDFGLVRNKYEVTEEIVIRNTSQIPAKWSIEESKDHLDGELNDGMSEFVFRPSSGDLLGLCSTVIMVTFNPSHCRHLRSVFECSVIGGTSSYIGVQADVKEPQACLLSCHLQMPEVYINVPIKHTVQLLNQTPLATRFFWGETQGHQSKYCTIVCQPKSGVLKPRQQIDIVIECIFRKQEELDDVCIPCHVEGMCDPVYLKLSATIQGLKVSYYKKDEQEAIIEDDDLSLDFGDVELGNVTKKVFCIKNQTAISASYNILVGHFQAGKPPTPPEEKKEKYENRWSNYIHSSPQSRSLLNRTQNIADPMSKSPSQLLTDYTKVVLREGKGVAFVVQPSCGMLDPFDELEVEVTAYADMWGQYSDDLVCKVSGKEDVIIPLSISITGCPLNFQMTTLKGQIPVVRFGTHIPGVAAIKRPLRIINKSSFDIRVDWQMFNLQENDNKLLDMITSIGDPFPECDENGFEIIPTETELSPRVKERELSPREKEDGLTPDIEVTGEEHGEPVSEVNERPQIIRVQFKEHEGSRAEEPFGIITKQMVIPARGSLQITATFSPSMVSPNQIRTVECVGYALGFMSLNREEDRFKERAYKRLHGYDTTPLRLNLTAFIKPAVLTIETADDDGMTYTTAASHLIVDGNIGKEYKKTGLATLMNNTETPLTFQVVVPEPFALGQVEPKTTGGTDGFITVKPRRNLQIQVSFRLTSELIQRYLDELRPDQEMEGVTLIKRDHERKFTIDKNLQIVYNNTSIQPVPLYASIVLPSLVLSCDCLDFGVCHVGQQREKEILLRNPTSSASFWTGVIDWCNYQDDAVFALTPSSGMLEAHVTHVSSSKTLLKVHFTAMHNIEYDCIFVLRGMLGEEPCYLRVKGEGSYDSRHEALVNI